MVIYDARSYLNALANRVISGGYENTKDHYKECDLVFCDIDNIHAVRDSYNKVHELGLTDPENNPKWLSHCENSNWLQLISKILMAVNNILETINEKNVNVLIHCSDGWDRTA